MRSAPQGICRICFGVLLALGLGLLAAGLAVVPILPHFQLDAVLTREELTDAPKRAAMLALLKNANGNLWLFWAGAGLVAICASALGLWALGEVPGNGKAETQRIDLR
jgi:hypothetical protein